jgi:hypothetical protein
VCRTAGEEWKAGKKEKKLRKVPKRRSGGGSSRKESKCDTIRINWNKI